MDATLSTTQTDILAPALEPLDVKMVNKSLENGPIESNVHIAIAIDVLQSQTKLKHLAETVKIGGFVLVVEFHDVPENVIVKNNFLLVSKLSVENKTFYLLRKVR